MNQILGNQIPNSSTSFLPIVKKFKFIFWISFFIIIFCLIFYFFLQYNAWQKEKLSQNLTSSFQIRNLYADSNSYHAEKTLASFENKELFVIGLLKIDKIDLLYPILSTTTDELLKISPCRFYGPMPNEVGNLCIAGHNYANQKHFGKLSVLSSGDTIQIYDLNSTPVDYIIYKTSEVTANDTSCLNQNTNGAREVTLITCNTIKGTRVVIKAKENR